MDSLAVIEVTSDALVPRYRVEYSTNNSGGRWWLDDADWLNLEAYGWHIHWFTDDPFYADSVDAEGRYLGVLAREASKYFDDVQEGIDEWEDITHENYLECGCPCCGPPHSFSFYNAEDKCVGYAGGECSDDEYESYYGVDEFEESSPMLRLEG